MTATLRMTLALMMVVAASNLIQADELDPARSHAALEALKSSTEGNVNSVPLTKEDAQSALQILTDRRSAEVKTSRLGEFEARKIKIGELEMPFAFQVFGEKPKEGRSLYLSMHGGGNTAPQVNDRQYENQKKLYKPAEGVYLAPRAPTNTWDLWHQSHIDGFFERMIEDLVVFEGVDFNRVYLMGYSAGGDGVYQLAPRMADRLAAASMMAGHPNESSPMGLRNLPFAIHVGANDSGYNRNQVAREWGEKLNKLRDGDSEGYVHLTEIHPGRAHWMNLEDASAVPWMAKFRRDPTPKKVVWNQDDVTHDRFYWLAVEPGQAKARSVVVAEREGQRIKISEVEGVERLIVRLDDRMLDLDQPVQIRVGDKVVFDARVFRTSENLARTLAGPGDPNLSFAAEVMVRIPAPR